MTPVSTTPYTNLGLIVDVYLHYTEHGDSNDLVATVLPVGSSGPAYRSVCVR